MKMFRKLIKLMTLWIWLKRSFNWCFAGRCGNRFGRSFDRREQIRGDRDANGREKEIPRGKVRRRGIGSTRKRFASSSKRLGIPCQSRISLDLVQHLQSRVNLVDVQFQFISGVSTYTSIYMQIMILHENFT